MSCWFRPYHWCPTPPPPRHKAAQFVCNERWSTLHLGRVSRWVQIAFGRYAWATAGGVVLILRLSHAIHLLNREDTVSIGR
jgi:hypothetical protein